jgi:hypothetical protein
MKNQLKQILVLVILPILFGCEMKELALFDEPQPSDIKNLSKFPNRIQGDYLSLNDSSTLTIDDSMIWRISNFDYKIHPNELDENSKISGDSLFDSETGDKWPVSRDGDSLIVSIRLTDTLFMIKPNNFARKFKGYYFLNNYLDDLGWEVNQMKLKKGELSISSISSETDIKNLNEITETSTDTIPPFKYSVTKKQFKEFIRNNGFSDSEIFVKKKK